MNKKYLALTIGPIYQTFTQVKATRELWVASYLFSHLMQGIALAFKKADPQGTFLVPYVIDEPNAIPAGLYPDRLIFKPQQLILKDATALVDAEVENLADKVVEAFDTMQAQKVEIGLANYLLQDVRDQFRAYFRTYLVEATLADDNAVLELNQYLDTAELFPQYTAEALPNYLFKFITALKNSSRAAEIALKIIFKKSPPIQSLGEISTAGLSKVKEIEGVYQTIVQKWKEKEHQDDTAQDDLMQKLKANSRINEHFRTYHKYIAVVQADGDNIGATIKSLKGQESLYEAFSKKLYDLGKKAVQDISQYGGLPVYAGGDDLLFFAPLYKVDEKEKTLFHLLNDLDQQFKAEFEQLFQEWEAKPDLNFKQPDKIPTLSFGVSICYYKFPMAEAIEKSYHLLHDKAKEYPLDKPKEEKEKNAIALEILKHSGQHFGFTLPLAQQKETETLYTLFKTLMQNHLERESVFLNSVIHLMGRNEKVLEVIQGDKERLAHFFQNSLDESIHKKDEVQAYLNNARSVLQLSYKKEKTNKAALDTAYSILRTIHFLKQKDNE